MAELAQRLRGRGTETEEQVNTRLRNAASEMKNWPAYRYTILSGTMQEDVENFRSIMLAERSVSRRLHLSFT